MTALTVGFANAASTTLTTANTLYTISGSANAGYPHAYSAIANGVTGWGEFVAQGTSNAWAAGGAIGSPTGNGWLLDRTTLEGQTIASGNWTPTFRLGVFGGSVVATLTVRAYRRSSGGTYTNIISSTLSAQTLSGQTTFSFSAVSGAATDFATGDKLYLDIWANVTTNSNPTQMQVNRESNDTGGLTFDPNCQLVTPGYAATGGGPAPSSTLMLMGVG